MWGSGLFPDVRHVSILIESTLSLAERELQTQSLQQPVTLRDGRKGDHGPTRQDTRTAGRHGEGAPGKKRAGYSLYLTR